MKNENRWTKKRMKETYSQPKIMCQSNLYLFITKRYVLIETPPIHLQEICVSQNINSSSPRHICQSKHHLFISKRYVPIRNGDNMRSQILYTILNLFFIWIQSFKRFMFRVILAAWINKLHFFPLSTWIAKFHLFYNYYPFVIVKHLFYNGKKKIHSNGHTKHLGNYDWIHLTFKHMK